MKSSSTTFRKLLGLAAALAVSAGLYTALLRLSGTNPRGLWEIWRGAGAAMLAGTAAFSLAVHVFLGADKLWRVLKSSGFELPYTLVLKIRLGAGPLRLFMPVDAGEILNIAFFRRHQRIPVAGASGACLFDRGLNLLGSTFWLVLGLALAAGGGLPMSRPLAAAGVGGLYGLFLFAGPVHGWLIRSGERLHPKIGEFTAGVLGPFARCTAWQKVFFCAYGVVFQARPLVVLYLLFRAMGVQPEPGSFIAFASLAVFAGHLPSASGAGPREAALMALFAGAAPRGVLLAAGAGMSLLVHVLPMAAGLPWLPWFVKALALGPGKQAEGANHPHSKEKQEPTGA